MMRRRLPLFRHPGRGEHNSAVIDLLNERCPEGRHPCSGGKAFTDDRALVRDAQAAGATEWQEFICWLGHLHWKPVDAPTRRARAKERRRATFIRTT